MTNDVHFPAEVERAAAILEAHPHYRALRALPPLDLFPRSDPVGMIRTAVLIDTETTGLNAETDKIIELAALEVRFDARGKVVGYGRMRDWLEDPGQPLPPEITRLTGLRDEDLYEQRIPDAEAIEIIGGADLVVAHNARFDVAFVQARFPELVGRAWACSMAEIDWALAGYDGKKLAHLLLQAAMFHRSHRADADVLALAWLLASETRPGVTALRELIDTASRPSMRLEATGAPFAVKDLLKARGYRWCAATRVWSREVPAEAAASEIEWLTTEAGCRDPRRQEIDWFRRHR